MPATLKYSEHQLVELLKKHDGDAFAFLYDSYSPALYGIILKIVNSEETAQEVLQDVFGKIRKNFSTYDKTKGNLFSWMLNIARNSSIEALYKQQLKSPPATPSANETNKKEVVPHFEYASLADITKKLKEEQRTLIDMVYIRGYAHDKVSKELNLPTEAVKTRIHAAIGKLRELVTIKNER